MPATKTWLARPSLWLPRTFRSSQRDNVNSGLDDVNFDALLDAWHQRNDVTKRRPQSSWLHRIQGTGRYIDHGPSKEDERMIDDARAYQELISELRSIATHKALEEEARAALVQEHKRINELIVVKEASRSSGDGPRTQRKSMCREARQINNFILAKRQSSAAIQSALERQVNLPAPQRPPPPSSGRPLSPVPTARKYSLTSRSDTACDEQSASSSSRSLSCLSSRETIRAGLAGTPIVPAKLCDHSTDTGAIDFSSDTAAPINDESTRDSLAKTTQASQHLLYDHPPRAVFEKARPQRRSRASRASTGTDVADATLYVPAGSHADEHSQLPEAQSHCHPTTEVHSNSVYANQTRNTNPAMRRMQYLLHQRRMGSRALVRARSFQSGDSSSRHISSANDGAKQAGSFALGTSRPLPPPSRGGAGILQVDETEFMAAPRLPAPKSIIESAIDIANRLAADPADRPPAVRRPAPSKPLCSSSASTSRGDPATQRPTRTVKMSSQSATVLKPTKESSGVSATSSPLVHASNAQGSRTTQNSSYHQARRDTDSQSRIPIAQFQLQHSEYQATCETPQWESAHIHAVVETVQSASTSSNVGREIQSPITVSHSLPRVVPAQAASNSCADGDRAGNSLAISDGRCTSATLPLASKTPLSPEARRINELIAARERERQRAHAGCSTEGQRSSRVRRVASVDDAEVNHINAMISQRRYFEKLYAKHAEIRRQEIASRAAIFAKLKAD